MSGEIGAKLRSSRRGGKREERSEEIKKGGKKKACGENERSKTSTYGRVAREKRAKREAETG